MNSSKKKVATVSKLNSKIEFKYIFDDDYNPVYVNGAYGGVTPCGEIVVNFYLERHALPIREIVDSSGGGVVLPEGCAHNYVRVIETGVVLSLDSAKSILKWLEQKIQYAENIQQGNGEKKDADK
ncbi:MAG: hypothetical protein PHY48_08160 [Candidatus Cloacimonetes bacterium]|nr:hypothetical protein [Candidatus Cloacimonadota bacterium]